ncbi:RNA-directed DNA polymerase from mobile element jockey [Smittium culicis]|uniref:RNA-directed DNA polymerase from mobile element jockey n=1 Tax=Smittium culicis TaxID=133412 RepID=A0A1R1XCB7_9FUNG|nr:RNA-directed DNA polymerase from mobile element jockey [Smittium culicis]
MDTPASIKFTLKLGTGFQHAKVTYSTGSRPLRPHADHSAVDLGRSRECENSILWFDITQALADTPNSKASGADGVPSENKETWLRYIDYSKAYDRVPHMALLHKLRSLGIGGKLLNTIKGMYDAPKIAVRVGNEVSSPTEYLFRVQQGCPASPILFDFYINDIFKGVRGVRMPVLTSRIPGLLFADVAMLLAESSDELQDALNTITEWSGTWEMAVNASKCGIMTISRELTTDMTMKGHKVNSTDQYTYLGYIMNSKWDVSGTIKNNKNKVRKAVYAVYSFLGRSDVLTALKIKFINSVLVPIGCYGGETFGMSEARCKPIQPEIDKEIRMVSNVGKSAVMERIRDELGITSVLMRTSTARERAYHKWSKSKSWIADLIKAPMKARMATWVTGSAHCIKKFCSQDSNGQTIITIVDRKRRNNRSVIHRWTVDRKIGKKGNWVDLQAIHPDLKLGL